jgi:hypothetical protein
MKCDVHPDRGGILFVDLPSIGVRRWGCFECRANFDKKMLEYKSPRQEARNGWPQHYREQYGSFTCDNGENPDAVHDRIFPTESK